MKRAAQQTRYLVMVALVATAPLPVQSQATVPILGENGLLATRPPPTARATTVSAAADLAGLLAGSFNLAALPVVILQRLEARDAVIKELLRTTGQPGVLVEARVQSIVDPGGGTVYTVVGNDVAVVGAGTSPLAVRIASAQLGKSLINVVAAGNRLEANMGVFFWCGLAGDQVEVTIYPAPGVIRETARLMADGKLLANLERTNEAAAIAAAADHLERTIQDAVVKAEIAELKERQEAQNRQVREIEERLARELERARRANAAAGTLALIGTALTLASQITLVAQSLGSDAPPGIQDAQNPADLQSLVDNFAKAQQNKADQTGILYKQHVDAGARTRTELLVIIRESDYPDTNVPELRLP